MKRLLLILSLAFIAISCEEDQIVPAVEGPALTVAIGSAAYTDVAGIDEAIQLTSFGDVGIYEFDKTMSIFTNSNRKFMLDENNNLTGSAQTDEGWSENGRTSLLLTRKSLNLHI